MNTGDFCASTAAMPAAATLLTPPHSLSAKSLSLALQTGTMGEHEHHQINGYDSLNKINGRRRSRDDERESRSGNDNAASGDDQDADDGDGDRKPPRKKRYHRHTPHQIQELEAMFKECPHPDEKQRLELSRSLCLDPRQVKFWFQNRRTQMKTQLERHESSILRAENDKLRAENMSIREAMRSPSCANCGGPAMIGEISIEEQHLRIENARLKDELDRVCALAGKFLGRPVAPPPIPRSSLQLGVGCNGFDGLIVPPDQFGVSVSSSLPAMDVNSTEIKSVYLELAVAAMDVLMKMARSDEPLWLRRAAGGTSEVLNHDEYLATFTRCTGLTPPGFTAEASRDGGVVIINSSALVETLMDSNKWAEMFPCIIAKSCTTDVVSTGMGGTRNGSLQLMKAAFQVLSPLVPVREFNFLRFCKQHADGVWAVVDVSIDAVQESSGATGFPSCLRLPSGCVVEDMPNGYSKVTWVEHVEYDESVVHQLYRPLVRAGLGFGARRWLATLQRRCECLAILMLPDISTKDRFVAITGDGRRSMLKLAQRMTNSFCTGISASSSHKWSKLHIDNVDEKVVQVMTRKSMDEPGEPPGIVVSAATSVWLPVPPQEVFDFLRDEHSRSEWDILSNGGPMQEMARIAKGHGNSVSLLRASSGNMLILQETCTDAAGSLVVYAPVDIPAMQLVMNGGNSSYVALLPSGFSIVPDGGGCGSLLTVAFQILQTAELTVESVDTVNNLISCTIEKIRATLPRAGDHVRLT